MSLFTRVTAPDGAQKQIPIDLFISICSEYARGRATRKNIQNMLELNAAENADKKQFLDTLDTVADKDIYLHRIEHYLIMVHMDRHGRRMKKKPGWDYQDEANFWTVVADV